MNKRNVLNDTAGKGEQISHLFRATRPYGLLTAAWLGAHARLNRGAHARKRPSAPLVVLPRARGAWLPKPSALSLRWLLCGAGLFLCICLAIWPAGFGWTEESRSPLDADTLINVLRTRDADEESYCLYVSALVEQGQLPVGIAMGAMQWARQKPEGKRVQYFKHALIRLAADQGITMPEGTPARTGTIRGRCVVRVLGIDIPVVGGTVRLGDTNATATTDSQGRFEFTKVPFGRYRLQAEGVVSLITRRGSAEATCPSPPPSTQPTYVGIVMK